MTRVTDSDLSGRLATRAIHAGQAPDATTGAIMTPIYQTSTYVQPGLEAGWPYEYARTRNPTRDALERNVAALEGGMHGFAFSSGLAATEAVLKVLSADDHVICGENVYGGTHRLMTHVLSRFGFRFSFVDARDTERVAGAVTDATKMIFIETPTNPMMRIADLRAIAEVADDRGAMLVVDNTFASPMFQRPLEHGAHTVVHSTTKFLNGHSDMVGGMVVTNSEDLATRLAFLQNAAGAIPGPLDCWLAMRGTKTLPLRMKQHDASGRIIAQWLSQHAAVQQVFYPGLPSHPQHELACRQMSGFGGMISFTVGSIERARTIVSSTRHFALAESLGGVESLIGHPASMTHASVPPEMRRAMGLTDDLVRLSVGIEDTDDLLEDLDSALHAGQTA